MMSDYESLNWQVRLYGNPGDGIDNTEIVAARDIAIPDNRQRKNPPLEHEWMEQKINAWIELNDWVWKQVDDENKQRLDLTLIHVNQDLQHIYLMQYRFNPCASDFNWLSPNDTFTRIHSTMSYEDIRFISRWMYS